MRKTKKPLSLVRETVRLLDAGALTPVAGGSDIYKRRTYRTDACPTFLNTCSCA